MEYKQKLKNLALMLQITTSPPLSIHIVFNMHMKLLKELCVK